MTYSISLILSFTILLSTNLFVAGKDYGSIQVVGDWQNLQEVDCSIVQATVLQSLSDHELGEETQEIGRFSNVISEW